MKWVSFSVRAVRGNLGGMNSVNPGWWDNGRRLLPGSDRVGRTNLFSVHLESGEITRHTAGFEHGVVQFDKQS